MNGRRFNRINLKLISSEFELNSEAQFKMKKKSKTSDTHQFCQEFDVSSYSSYLVIPQWEGIMNTPFLTFQISSCSFFFYLVRTYFSYLFLLIGFFRFYIWFCIIQTCIRFNLSNPGFLSLSIDFYSKSKILSSINIPLIFTLLFLSLKLYPRSFFILPRIFGIICF